MSASLAVVCEIFAPRAAQVAAFAEIASLCANDLGQPLIVKAAPAVAAARQPLLTLHLPAEFAASQHQVWCLACRLACFCPDARVSVLVKGEHSFASPPRPRSRRDVA